MNTNSELYRWMLDKENPAVRYRTLTEVIGRSADHPEVIESKNELADGEAARKILSQMHPDGYWLAKNRSRGEYLGDGVEYSDFNTTHFCLAYLAELGLTRDHPQLHKAADRYLNLQQEDGDFMRHFSCLYALNIRTFIRLGFRDDPRLKKTIDLMLSTERPDGGYLCDMHEGKYKTKPVKSCIRGSVKALLAFADLPEYRDHPRCRALADYFLERDCLFRTDDPAKPVNDGMITNRFPVTWRASLIEVVYALSKMGYGLNRHLDRAWELLNTKKDTDGKYILDWTPGQVQKLFKVGKRNEPNKWITLYALLALKARDETIRENQMYQECH